MARRKPTVSTAPVVRESIDTHPSIKDGIPMRDARPSPCTPGPGLLRSSSSGLGRVALLEVA